jgi:hypothetical protein
MASRNVRVFQPVKTIRLGCVQRHYWILAALALGFAAVHWFLQPRIGVRDVDAFAYVVGAFSIASGHCYCDLSGGVLVHWPPAYSFLLSLFPGQLNAALWINHVSLLVAAVALYLLLRIGGWKWSDALGLCLVLGFGFFLRLSGNAAPDILTYAVFLVGVLVYQSPNRGGRFTAYLLWAVLIPFKLIAVVFIPAAIVFEMILVDFRVTRSDLTTWSVAATIELLAVSSILEFNYHASSYFISPKHPRTNLGQVTQDVFIFVKSIFRSFLWSWYGSIKSVPVLALFVITMLLALFCLLSLKARGNEGLWLLGVCVLLTSFGLLFIRHFGTVRLFGYGLLPMLAGRKPAGSAKFRWILYGIVAFVVSTINARTNNTLGINDPRYEQLAKSVSELGGLEQPVGTNSFHILDIHRKIATQPIQDPNTWLPSPELLDPASSGRIQTILWVRAPHYDTVAMTVWPMERPGAGWCEIGSVTGATIFRRCANQVPPRQ